MLDSFDGGATPNPRSPPCDILQPREQEEVQVKSPYETVREAYDLPFELYPFQIQAVNELAPLPRSAYYAEPGTGKTPMSTVHALYKKLMSARRRQTLVLLPPILIQMWARWLARIKGIDVTVYRGTPAERKRIALDGDFLLMSLPIFKKDYERLCADLGEGELTTIVDEATSIKSVDSDNHKMVREFTQGRDLVLLTGSPLSTPMDGYAYCKLIAPGLYRNQRHFENLHVEERDFFGHVKKWCNLDLLQENMKVNSVRILKREVLAQLPPLTYTPIEYELDPKHYRLYCELAEEQLLRLPGGGKIDATTASSLPHALQQIVVNWDHFSGDPGLRSEAYALVDEVMEELDGRKLVLFASYKMTIRALLRHLEKYHAVAIYGEITAKQQERNVDRFVRDAECQVIVIQPQAGSMGLDGLQHVCSDVLWLETPAVPMWFHQGNSRLERDGQKNPINVRLAIASRTVQVRRFRQLLERDELVNYLVRGYEDLRDAIFGK